MNIISMKNVVGSDTLLQSTILESKYDYFKADHACDLIRGVRVAENIWQSTANNLIIPEGLVCDVEYCIVDYCNFANTWIRHGISSGSCLNDFISDENVTAIKVTGTQECWRYEWENGE